MASRMARHYRKVTRWIEYILETFEEASDSPRDHIRVYEREFAGRRFPFWYARARTEFGVVFGRKVSAEDAEWGKYRPVNEVRQLSVDERIEMLQDSLPEQAVSMPDLEDELERRPW